MEVESFLGWMEDIIDDYVESESIYKDDNPLELRDKKKKYLDNDIYPKIEASIRSALKADVIQAWELKSPFELWETISKSDPYKKTEGFQKQVKEFIREWMDKFEIGVDFTKSKNELLIKNDEDEEGEPLSQKGTGTKHFMTLLFNVTRHMVEHVGKFSVLPLLLIEEPEQNLHPKLQSLMMDFIWDIVITQRKWIREFCDKNAKHDLQIIVETHSEYIIRKSQQYVKAYCKFGDIEICPFKTFYFPTDKAPYDMKYTETGRFERRFGSGFYDEAAKLSFDILSL